MKVFGSPWDNGYGSQFCFTTITFALSPLMDGAAMTQLLRTAEVSARIGTSKDTLRWWRHIGEGPPSFKLGRKNVVYPLDELEAWIERCQAATRRGDMA